ncbi:hypothetical protein Syun_022413 [Stephania yunnanensis]|uniref:Peptidase A1 domain-containing protein n=1 Tax=Stephania yunnanensis TaxID=152371 RepID=A0AAP0F9K1_9MAGN
MAIVQALLISLTILLFPLLLFKTNDKVPMLMLPIEHRDDTNPSLALLPIVSGDAIDVPSNFVVIIGVGNPTENFYLTFDTGSNVAWIQCEPRINCYKQKNTIFKPSSSITYSQIPSSSPVCSNFNYHARERDTPTTCAYSIKYGDKSYTNGILVRETLTLTPNHVFPGFLLGCGHNNSGSYGTGAGVLGLARDPISIVSQLSSTFGRVFSYCLPYLKDSKGYLALGRSTTSSSTATKYTPIIKDPSQPSRNFIHFIGISIDGRKLPIDPSILNSPGTILDTGTPITRLPAKAYTVLRDSFRRLMAAYPLGEKAKTLDTCYLITEAKLKQIPLPKIVMHFKDVDVEVHRSGILVKTRKVFCLAFSAKRDEGTPGIIGNKQQSTYEVVYDLDGEKIGFRPNGCS